jgi:uncharacterized protein (TIGR00730 family)
MNPDNNKHPLGENAQKFEIKRKEDKPNKNIPEAHADHTHKHVSDYIDKELHERAGRVEEELVDGFHAIREYPKSVTFFGSARFPEEHPYYQKARTLAGKICEMGYAVITGGGPGIMEAGNRGSKEACGSSVGFNIELPNHQIINPYVTHGVDFHYFFSRKVSLAFSAETYLYFPGGFGTLDEFFEILTLIQTKKIPPVPVICVCSDYWNPLDSFIRKTLLESFGTISAGDTSLYKILDNDEEILEVIREAKLRNEYE